MYKQFIRSSHTHSKSLFTHVTVSCQLSGESITNVQFKSEKTHNVTLTNTFYKPSPEIINSPYFKHVYNKNYTYAALEIHNQYKLCSGFPTKQETDKINVSLIDYTFWGP